LRDPNTDESTLYTANAVLDLLHVAGVEVGDAAEALQALYFTISAFASPNFGTGALPVEVAQERLACAAYDAANFVAALGERGTDLEFHVVLREPRAKRWETCVHEGAHAATAVLLLDSAVELVSVAEADTAPDDMEGVTTLNPPFSFILNYANRPQEPLRSALEPTARRLAVVALAGGYGAAGFIKDRFPSFGTDLAQARRLCTFFAPDGKEEAMWKESHYATSLMANAARNAIEAVARSLLDRQKLTGVEVEAIVAAHADRRLDNLRDDLFPEP
jgi:hypothetical protein